MGERAGSVGLRERYEDRERMAARLSGGKGEVGILCHCDEERGGGEEQETKLLSRTWSAKIVVWIMDKYEKIEIIPLGCPHSFPVNPSL